MKALAGFILAAAVLQAAAHDLITAESAQGYLLRQEQLGKAIHGRDDPQLRASALVELGAMLDEIRELFNRDIEAHGKVQGLPSNFLMNELRVRESGLEWSAARNRFLANLRYYREALRLHPEPAIAADASFRLLQGWFYDSFTEDPLAPTHQTPVQLAGQIRIAERYLVRHPSHAGNEEAAFILAVHYMQAAVYGEREQRSGYAKKARALSAEYTAQHPDNLRVPTLNALLERIAAP